MTAVRLLLGAARDLAFGVAVTIVVSWFAMVIGEPRSAPVQALLERDGDGTTVLGNESTAPARVDFTVLTIRLQGMPPGNAVEPSRLPWRRAHPLVGDGASCVVETSGFAVGWPCLAMWGEHPPTASFGDSMRATLPARAPLLPLRVPGRIAALELPLSPLWPGFAVNAVIAAALIRGALIAFGAARRIRRDRRGLCRRCGHSLGAAALCPECGHASVSRAGSGA